MPSIGAILSRGGRAVRALRKTPAISDGNQVGKLARHAAQPHIHRESAVNRATTARFLQNPLPQSERRMADTTREGTETDSVRYPMNRVVGVIDSVSRVHAAVDALTSGGFLESEIEVFHGQAAAEALRSSTGRTGFANLVMRLIAAIGLPNDETALKNRYADAIRDGRFVVTVEALTEERKALAARLLQDQGGEGVNFFNRFTIESLGQSRSG
jgi:hypothetical protein